MVLGLLCASGRAKSGVCGQGWNAIVIAARPSLHHDSTQYLVSLSRDCICLRSNREQSWPNATFLRYAGQYYFIFIFASKSSLASLMMLT